MFLWVCVQVHVLSLKFVFLAERSHLIWVQHGWNTNKTTQRVWDVQWVRWGGASLQCLGVRLVLPNDQNGLCQYRAVQVGGQAPVGGGQGANLQTRQRPHCTGIKKKCIISFYIITYSLTHHKGKKMVVGIFYCSSMQCLHPVSKYLGQVRLKIFVKNFLWKKIAYRFFY